MIKILLYWVALFAGFGLFLEYTFNREFPFFITFGVSFIFGWLFVNLLKLTSKFFTKQ